MNHCFKLEQRKLSIIRNVIAIGYFSILGSLLRLCLVLISQQHSEYIEYLFFSLSPNIFGCIVMGFATQFKKKAEAYYLVFAYLGLTTGFCGSLTSFSTWIYKLTLDFVTLPQGTKPSDIVVIFITNIIVIFLELLLFIISHKIGEYFAKLAIKLKELLFESDDISLNEESSHSTYNYIKDIMNMMIFVVVIIFFIAVMPNLHIAPITILNSPLFLLFFTFSSMLGAICRYFIGFWFNDPNSRYFPQFGTFLSNMIACILLSVSTFNNENPEIDNSHLYYDGVYNSLIISIQFGFCGCLSTISTFIAEVCTIKFHQSIIYIIASTVVAQVLIFILIELQILL